MIELEVQTKNDVVMKARIRKTGEIINIANYAKVTLDQCDSWGNPIELGLISRSHLGE